MYFTLDMVNEIINNSNYIKYSILLEELEKDRVFCKHGIGHSLSVARIAYIKVLEDKLSYSKQVIYAIALLHDIGRVLEYKENIPHDTGSLILSKKILDQTSFSSLDKQLILKAIGEHRNEEANELSRIIFFSDKLSRNCFSCISEEECYWANEKKNFKIKY